MNGKTISNSSCHVAICFSDKCFKSRRNCHQKTAAEWRKVTIYFLMTDRFANGDRANDPHSLRSIKPGKLRGFIS